MTNREILLSAIRLEKTPRLPVIILSSGVWNFYRNGLTLQDALKMEPEKAADYIIKSNEEVGSDLIWTAADCSNVALHAIGAKCTFDKLGGAATIDEPLIKKPEDVDQLSINNLELDPGIVNLLKTTRIIADRVGKQYLIGISQWGPFTFAGQLMGLEKLLITTMRDKAGIKHVLDFSQKVIIKYLELFLDAGAELINLSEPSSSCDLISPKMFEELALPYIKKTNEALGMRGKARMLHICGNTTKLLDLIPETKTDLYSMDYKVNLKLSREKLGGKVAFAGQLDPVSVMLEATVEEVKKAAEKCIEDAGLEGGYVLMPGCDIPPKTKVENVKAMVEVALGTQM